MLLPITIDKLSSVSFQEQIAEQLRRFILEGLLVPGTRVPTSRELARQAGLSRNTVTLAYERLIGEGYLQTRPASGTFVAEVFSNPDLALPAAARPEASLGGIPRRPVVFSGQAWPRLTAKPEFDCRLFSADPSIFPTREWRRHILSALEHHGGRMGNTPPPAGEQKLRHAIARWLSASRGITATADDVLVVAGRQQAYNIAAQLLLRPGDGVVVEAPCNLNAALVFEAAQANLLPVPVDERGIRPDLLPSGPALAYLTPSHQSPVGGTLPLDRREAVLAWARANGTYLFEDDIGCEFHYDGWQPPSLKSMDRNGLVIYCGSFTLTLGAGLRLGYMVLPPELASAALAAKTCSTTAAPGWSRRPWPTSWKPATSPATSSAPRSSIRSAGIVSSKPSCNGSAPPRSSASRPERMWACACPRASPTRRRSSRAAPSRGSPSMPPPPARSMPPPTTAIASAPFIWATAPYPSSGFRPPSTNLSP